MKLIDVLRFMSFDVDVIIYDNEVTTDEEPLFKGGAQQVPWTLVNKELPQGDGTIFTCTETNEYGVNIPYIIFYIIMEE